jgi:two-component system, sensor histidine kinase and response regulator
MDREETDIVAMTANAMDGDRERCLEAGMDDYIAKPVTASLLSDTIARVVDAGPGHPPAAAPPPDAAPRSGDPPQADRAAALDRVDGDEDLLREIASLFVDDAPARLGEIKGAMAAGDAVRAGRAAHSLKGSVSNFGAPTVVRLALDLEQQGKAGDLAAMARSLPQLEAELSKVVAEVETWR